MNLKNRKRLFIRFLKENNALKEFKNNLGETLTTMDELIKKGENILFFNEITSGFVWSRAKDNIDWDILSSKWDEVIEIIMNRYDENIKKKTKVY